MLSDEAAMVVVLLKWKATGGELLVSYGRASIRCLDSRFQLIHVLVLVLVLVPSMLLRHLSLSVVVCGERFILVNAIFGA